MYSSLGVYYNITHIVRLWTVDNSKPRNVIIFADEFGTLAIGDGTIYYNIVYYYTLSS